MKPQVPWEISFFRELWKLQAPGKLGDQEGGCRIQILYQPIKLLFAMLISMTNIYLGSYSICSFA
jgi:hypothetical protein